MSDEHPTMTQRDSDLTRRDFLAKSALAVGAPVVLPLSRLLSPLDEVTIIQFSDAEWRKQLPPLAFTVARKAGTERSFTGAYWNLHEKGLFRCLCCDNALFSSSAKFDSGTGWPSFWQPIAAENVVGPAAQSPGADATEVTCHRCDAHLGDIFDDGPKPTGLRYCIDSISLRFVKAP